MKRRSFQIKEERRIKGKFGFRQSRPRKIEQEFGPGQRNILLCRQCGAFYWYKSWHCCLEDYPQLKEDKQIKFTLCPAC